jgi:hypothetical protein
MRTTRLVCRLSIFSILATTVLTASACSGPGTPNRQAGPQAPKDPVVVYDHGLTDVARVLAGRPPDDQTRFRRVLDRPSWKTHAALFDSNWAHNEGSRFGLMRTWRDKEFGSLASTCDTLFYPFGGPDALNAVLLFPKCNSYLLFGLEPLGSVPALDKLSDKQIDALTAELRQSMADIFQRNYFITSRMMKDLRKPEIDGNLPLFLVFLARLDARIVAIDHEGPWKPWGVPGVSIRFVAAHSDRVQTLTYIRVDMEDRALSKKTALGEYLRGLGTVTTFVKSASYLMHDNHFSLVRGIVLKESRMVLQDDSGIPYAFFKRADWDITLYGQYRKPVKDFNYGFQKDLDAVYKTPGTARPLPFSFGYHWGDGGSSVMLAVKRAP